MKNRLDYEVIYKNLNVRFKCIHCGFTHGVIHQLPNILNWNGRYTTICTKKHFKQYGSLIELVNENAIDKDYYEVNTN